MNTDGAEGPDRSRVFFAEGEIFDILADGRWAPVFRSARNHPCLSVFIRGFFLVESGIQCALIQLAAASTT